MASSGTIDLRGSGRIVGLPDPIDGKEPRLSRDTAYRPITGGRILTNERNLTALTTVAINGDLARFSLLEVDTDIVISGMSVEVAASPVANGFRLAIYKTNNNYYPTTLVRDGSFDIGGDTLGIKNDPFGSNVSLRAGVYAVGIKMSLSVLTFRAVAQTACSPLLGRQNIAGYPAITGFQVPFVWASGTPWPTTFPPLTVTNLTNVAQVLHSFTTV